MLSLASYSTVKDRLDRMAVDREADFSRADFDAGVAGARILATILVGTAVATVIARRRVDRALVRIGRSARADFHDLFGGIPVAVRAESVSHLALMGSICALGLALRLEHLELPMRFDEAQTFLAYASKPLHSGLTNYDEPNNHLFHTFLVHVSTSLFGGQPWAIRLPALVAGVLVVPATYALVRLLFEARAALIAAMLVAVSSTLIEYSTNARGYTLVTLLFLVMLIVGARVIETNAALGWTCLVVLAALAIYTLPPAIYAVGGALSWLLLSRLLRRALPATPFLWRFGACVLGIAVVTLILYAPVVGFSGARSITNNQYVLAQPWHEFVREFPASLRETWGAWNRDVVWPARVGLAAAFIAGLTFSGRLSPFPISPALTTVVCSVFVLLAQRVVPYTRVWLFLVPLYLGTAAGLLSHVLRRARIVGPRAFWATAAVLSGAFVWLAVAVASSSSIESSSETGTLADGPAIARFLDDSRSSIDSVLSPGAGPILAYYLHADGVDPAPLIDRSGELGRRVLILVKTRSEYTLGGLMAEINRHGEWSAPQLVRSYPSARLYKVVRRTSGARS